MKWPGEVSSESGSWQLPLRGITLSLVDSMITYKACQEEEFYESLWHLASGRLGFTTQPVLELAWVRFSKAFSRSASGDLETVMKEVWELELESHGLFNALPSVSAEQVYE